MIIIADDDVDGDDMLMEVIMVTMMWMARRRLRNVASATPSCFRDVLLCPLVDALQNDITNMLLDDWQGPPFSPTLCAIRTQMLRPVYALGPPGTHVVNRGEMITTTVSQRATLAYHHATMWAWHDYTLSRNCVSRSWCRCNSIYVGLP